MDGPVFYDELNSPRYDPQRLVAENVDRYQRIDNLLTQVSAAYASRKWVDVYNLRRVCVQLAGFRTLGHFLSHVQWRRVVDALLPFTQLVESMPKVQSTLFNTLAALLDQAASARLIELNWEDTWRLLETYYLRSQYVDISFGTNLSNAVFNSVTRFAVAARAYYPAAAAARVAAHFLPAIREVGEESSCLAASSMWLLLPLDVDADVVGARTCHEWLRLWSLQSTDSDWNALWCSIFSSMAFTQCRQERRFNVRDVAGTTPEEPSFQWGRFVPFWANMLAGFFRANKSTTTELVVTLQSGGGWLIQSVRTRLRSGLTSLCSLLAATMCCAVTYTPLPAPAAGGAAAWEATDDAAFSLPASASSSPDDAETGADVLVRLLNSCSTLFYPSSSQRTHAMSVLCCLMEAARSAFTAHASDRIVGAIIEGEKAGVNAHSTLATASSDVWNLDLPCIQAVVTAAMPLAVLGLHYQGVDTSKSSASRALLALADLSPARMTVELTQAVAQALDPDNVTAPVLLMNLLHALEQCLPRLLFPVPYFADALPQLLQQLLVAIDINDVKKTTAVLRLVVVIFNRFPLIEESDMDFLLPGGGDAPATTPSTPAHTAGSALSPLAAHRIPSCWWANASLLEPRCDAFAELHSMSAAERVGALRRVSNQLAEWALSFLDALLVYVEKSGAGEAGKATSEDAAQQHLMLHAVYHMARQMSPAFARRVVARITDWLATATPFPNTLLMSVVLGGFSQCEAAVSGLQSLLQSSLTTLAAPDTPDTRLQWHAAIAVGIVANPDAAAACVDMLVRAVQRLVSHSEKKVRKEGLRLLQYTLRSLSYVSVAPATQGPSAAFAYGTPALQHFDTLLTRAATGAGHVLPQLCDTLQARVDAPTPARRRAALDLMNAMLVPAVAALYEALPSGFQPTVPSFAAAAAASTSPHASTEAGGDGGSQKPRKSADLLARHTKLVSRCLMGAFAAIPEVLRDVDDTLVHLGSNCARFVWCPLRRCVVDENDEIAAGSSYVSTLCSLRAALTLVAVDLCVAFQRDDVLSRNASLMRKLVAILRSAAYLGSHVVPWQIVTTHESHSSDIGEGGAFGVTSIIADVIAAIERAATCGQLPGRYAAIVLYPQPLVSWISWVRSEHRQYGRRANAKRRMLRWLQHQADGTDAVLEGEQIEEDGGEEDEVEEVEAEGEADEVLDDEEVDADEATMGMGEQDHDELVKSISVARSLALPAWQDAAVLRERLSHLLGTSAPDNVAAAELPRLLSMAAAMDLSRHPLRNVVELAVDTMVRLSTLTPWLYNPLLQKTLADSSTLPSVPGMDAAVVTAPAAGLSASPAPEPPSPDAAAGGATSLTDVSLSAGRDLFCRITSIVAVLAARWSRIVTKAENVPDYVRVLVQCEALVLSTRQPEVQRARQAIAMLLEQCVTYWNPMSVRRASNAVSEEATLHDVQARIMHIMYPTYNVAVDVGGDSTEPARAARVLDSRGAPVSSAAPLSGCQVRPGLEASLGVLSAFVTPVVLRTLSSPLLPAATTASVAAASKRPPPQTVECAEAVWLWCMSALLSPDKAVVRGAAAMLARCLLMRWMKQQSALVLLPLPRVHALMRSASYVSQLVMALTGVVAAGRNTITLQWPNLRSPETTFHAPFALLSELMCMLFPESAPLLAVALEELVEARAGAGASFPGTSVPGDAGSATAVSDNPALQPEGTHDQSTVVRRRIVAVHLVSGMLRFSVLAGVWRGTNTTSAPSGPTSPTCESDIECTAARAAVAEQALALLFHLVKTGNSLSIATLRRAMLHILHGIPRVLRTRLEARIVAHVVRVVARTRQHVDTALSESCLMGTSLALRVVDSASDGASAAASTAPGAAATFAAFGRWVALLRAVLQAYRVSTSAHGTSCLNPLLTNAQALQLCYGTLAAVRNLSAADMQDDVAALAAEDDVTGVLFSPELREGLVQLLDHPFQDCRFAAGLALGALIQVQALPQYVSDVSGRGEWATAWEAAFYSRALGKAFYWFVLNRTTSSSEETPEKTAATNFMEALLLMLLGLRQGVLGICQWAPAAALFPAALRACQASQSTLSSYADTVCTKLGQLPWRPLFACDEQRALRQWRSLQLVCQQNFSSSSACAGVLADLEAMPLAAPRESSSSAEVMASRAHLSCASIMFALFQRMVILPAAASSTNQHQSAVDASPALVPAGSTTSGGVGGSGASSRLASWTVRFGALTGFQRSWQSQYLNMAPHQQEELLRLVCTALRDESVEVQDAASELLVSTILCMPLEVQLRFAHDQVTSARAVKLPAARRVGAARGEDSSPPVPAAGADKQKGMRALRTRTAHVRAALAVMRSHPFDLPAALVDVVDALTRFAQDPAPIGFAVKHAFKDFYHTHQDNWTAHRDMFTPDQLTNFMEVLGTPSYFA